MSPMSMPSSSELVATSAGSRPDLRSSSIRSRCSRAIEPWCAWTSSSPASSLSAPARRSARRREFTKMSVERCERMSSRIWGWIAGQIDERWTAVTGPGGISAGSPRRAMSSTGTSTRSSRVFLRPASSTRTGRGTPSSRPPRNRAISSRGRCVAERPTRCSFFAPRPRSSSSRSSVRAR